jgi:putative tricarboxylic transport membrane protein
LRLNDAVWGALVLLLGAGIFFAIRNFPTIPGQQYGPALFPGVIAAGLLACGVGLIFKGIAGRAARDAAARWIAWDPWVRSSRHVVAFVVVAVVNVFYIAFVDRIGFVIASVVYLGALFAVFRVRARWVVPLAIVVTLLIHYVFYKLLRVPLPWGLLQKVAW